MSYQLLALTQHGILGGINIKDLELGTDTLQVVTLPEGDALVASKSDQMTEPAAATKDYIEFYNLICSLYQYGPIIPFRFGTEFISLDKMAKALHGKEQEIRACFKTIADCAEYCLTRKNILLPEVEPKLDNIPDRAKTGVHYLLERKQHFDRLQSNKEAIKGISDSIVAGFSGCYREKLVRQPEGSTAAGNEPAVTASGGDRGGFSVDIHFLIPEDRQDDFKRRYTAHQLEQRNDVLSGPWPPFVFVNHYINMEVQPALP